MRDVIPRKACKECTNSLTGEPWSSTGALDRDHNELTPEPIHTELVDVNELTQHPLHWVDAVALQIRVPLSPNSPQCQAEISGTEGKWAMQWPPEVPG